MSKMSDESVLSKLDAFKDQIRVMAECAQNWSFDDHRRILTEFFLDETGWCRHCGSLDIHCPCQRDE